MDNKVEKILTDLKTDYQSIEPPLHLSLHGWSSLKKQLPERKQNIFFLPRARGLIFASIVLIFLVSGLFGLSKVTQATLPGDTLYPLKRVSENLISNTTDKQVKIDNRAQEIIGLAKKKDDDEKLLKKSVEEYKRTIVDVKKQVDKSMDDQKKLKKKLESRKQQLEEVKRVSPTSGKILEEAIEITEEGQEERPERKREHESRRNSKSEIEKEDE